MIEYGGKFVMELSKCFEGRGGIGRESGYKIWAEFGVRKVL